MGVCEIFYFGEGGARNLGGGAKRPILGWSLFLILVIAMPLHY